MKTMPDNSVDSVVTDPPYHLTSGKNSGKGFMGKDWDGGDIAFRVELWTEVLRVLKPGGHLLSFSGTRTYHRMVVAIEDAGFEIRDQIGWLYGSGFPKSHNVSKAIDQHLGQKGKEIPIGAEVKRIIPGADQNGTGSWIKDNGRTYQPHEYEPATNEAKEWEGWGSNLKPSWEPICVARKPLIGTIAENVLLHGTGAINIDECRVGTESRTYDLKGGENLNRIVRDGGNDADDAKGCGAYGVGAKQVSIGTVTVTGRWPANIITDGSDEVLEAFAAFGERKSRMSPMDTGTAARFFFCAKASKADRNGSKHPTVKPVALMTYLAKLTTPKGGTILDPFAGSGTTGQAALDAGFNVILIEKEAEYCEDIRKRFVLFMD
jgi:site-specific DNA-methyltransferase (adenine-specific)